MSNTFGWFSRALKQYESGRAEVKRVEAIRPDDPQSNGELRASIDIAVPMCTTMGENSGEELSPVAVTIREDGGLQVDFPPSVLPTINRSDDDRILVEERESARIEDGTILVTSLLTLTSEEKAAGTRTAEEERKTHHDEHTSEEPTTPENGIDSVDVPPDERTGTLDSEPAHAPDLDGDTGHEEPIRAARNEDVLPYEDTEYLQRIYDTCETFIEMAEVIEMDVSTETVRRYMTEAGIHEPASYNTVSRSDSENAASPERDASDTSQTANETTTENESVSSTVDQQSDETTDGTDSDDDPVEDIHSQQLVADGIGLPDGVTIKHLADAVESSITVHEVTQELHLERDEVHELLKRLNLLDLVFTRVWKQDDHEISRAEIADRIRQSVTNKP